MRTGGSRSRATSPIRRPIRCGSRRCGCRPIGCWSRPTLRTCRLRSCAGKPNQPANVVSTAQAVARRAACAVRGARRGGRGERGRGVRVVTARPELPGRPQHPRRDRAAGGALAGRCRARDRWRAGGAVRAARRPGRAPARGRARPAARAGPCATSLVGFSNVTVHFADALDLDFQALDPAPTAVVANLPYGIAATVILRTIDELPSVGRWVVMVQREVGERLAAAPGTSAYGAPSVLAQLACEVRVLRPVARTVFRPVPRVDSVLVGLRRRDGVGRVDRRGPIARPRCVRAPAQGAGRVARAGARAPRRACASARGRRWCDMGHPADERAERLSPDEFRELAARLSVR